MSGIALLVVAAATRFVWRHLHQLDHGDHAAPEDTRDVTWVPGNGRHRGV